MEHPSNTNGLLDITIKHQQRYHLISFILPYPATVLTVLNWLLKIPVVEKKIPLQKHF